MNRLWLLPASLLVLGGCAVDGPAPTKNACKDCGPEKCYRTILVPEKKYSKDEIIKTVMDGKRHKKHHNLVVIAEGVGNSEEIAKEIEDVSGIETRTTVLGHIQRGGMPTAYDRILATRMGHRAVELLIEGKSARVIGTVKGDIVDYDIHEALSMTRPFNDKLYQIAMDLV